jgi:NAD/NADP transhydrogenase alpha subunit
MTDTPRLWVRHEVRLSERRAPIVPTDARLLVEQGIAVTVEDAPQRIFPTSDYATAGCRIAAPGSSSVHWQHCRAPSTPPATTPDSTPPASARR